MKHAFVISGERKEFEVRPPSEFYRTQFGTVMASIIGHDGKSAQVSKTALFELSKDELKSVIKCVTDISFSDKEKLDLDNQENYKSAIAAAMSFFLELKKTTKE